jgi:hypothetical protein
MVSWYGAVKKYTGVHGEEWWTTVVVLAAINTY